MITYHELKILYEDNHLIVVIKPAGVLSQADNTKDIDMVTLLKAYIKDKYQKQGNVYLGLCHRLDRMTSGVMVFAKTSKAAMRINKSIEKKEMRKKYYTLIEGTLYPLKGSLIDYLSKDENTGITTIDKQGKEAILEYEVIKKIDKISLVKVDLITGRHHQIRVQFASRNYPILGDALYGQKYDGRLYLHAYSLTFIHPITKEELTFTALPTEGMWIKFFDNE